LAVEDGSGRLLYIGSGSALPTAIENFDGATVLTKTGLSSMETAPRKRVSSWGGSTKSVTGDGVPPASGAFDGNMGAGATTLIGVGCNPAATGSEWFGNIRNVRIGQRQLATSEQMAITT
ncbi:MAG TPA: hypothetical protein PLX97_12900, partial [Gemmatales bacterium]|nr:hypothetical protein [Gemmatales bacterium]